MAQCLEEFKFKHPFTAIVSGKTSSGKTEFTRKLISNWRSIIKINVKILNVLWCYSEFESIKELNITNVKINYYKGVPTKEDIQNYSPNLIVLDDLMSEVTEDIKNLYTKLSHHKNISILLILQNLYYKNKYMKDIRLNTQYYILMKGSSEEQVGILGRQLYSAPPRKIINIFNHATTSDFGYLIFDDLPRTKPQYRLKTRIFNDELSPQIRSFHSFCPIYYNLRK